MRNEKRLFLLALLTTLFSMNSYSAKYQFKEDGEIVKQEYEQYQLTASAGKTITVTNKTDLVFDSSIKVGINLYNSTSNGKNIFINDGKIINSSEKGIQIGKAGTVENKGEFIVNSGSGIIVNDKTALLNNSGSIIVNNGEGIK